MRREQIFGLYRGDEFVDVGTAKEIGARQNIKPSTVVYYASPFNVARAERGDNGRRMVAVRVDDDE